MKKVLIGASLITGIFMMSSCSKDDIEKDSKIDLVIPTIYDSTDYAKNAAEELSLLARLSSISTEMKKGRNNGTTVEYSVLSSILNDGSISLKSAGSAYYLSKIDGAGNWLDQLSKASGGTYSPSESSENGGTYGGFLFDKNGVEIEQIVEKGMFGAVLYKHANDLLNGTIDAKTADKVLAIFGAHPSFANSNDASKHTNPDKFIANYVDRRDKNDPANPGFYLQIKNALIKLQAAGKAGNEYKTEQKEAADAIRINWEKGNAATIINYSFSVIDKLSMTSPTDADRATAMHSVGECIGFVHGLKSISNKKITDTQLDELLVLFNAPANGNAAVYKFATDGANELSKIQDVITKLKVIYGFTDAEVQDFKQNWVSVQKR